MKVLICGGSGFLGRALRTKLSILGAEVTLVSRKDSPHDCTVFNNEKRLLLDWPSGIIDLSFCEYDFFLYLSHAPVSESMSLPEVLRLNLTPLKLSIETIEKQKATPHLVFISSQSAASSVKSNYGELKRISEEILRQANLPVTVIRPGLIIGSGTSGLFNSIKKVIQISPVIPLIGSPSDIIQPLFMDDFVRVVFKVTGMSVGMPRGGFRNIELADKPISFHSFLRKMVQNRGFKKILLPVPNSIAKFGLWVLEHVFRFKKITSSSLLGFLQLTPLDCESIWKELNDNPTPLEDAIRISMSDAAISDSLNSNYAELLSQEVRFFCLRLFRMQATAEMVNAYINAHEKLPKNLLVDKEKVQTILHYKLDPVAVEFAVRPRLKSLNLKLSLVCYLAENLPGYNERFDNVNANRIKVFTELLIEIIRAPFIFIKGFYLSRRYQLV